LFGLRSLDTAPPACASRAAFVGLRIDFMGTKKEMKIEGGE
jgi:hypothetical protein